MNTPNQDLKRIWVYLEQEEGQAHPVSWELLGAAQRLAADLPGSVVEGLLLGHQVEHIAAEAYRYGASRVYLVDDPVLEVYRNLPYGLGISNVCKSTSRNLWERPRWTGAWPVSLPRGFYRPDCRLYRAGD
jgi:electron transfer flavoprotein alpha subunit